MSKNVRVGIIGMGNMGCAYAKMIILGQVPGFELAAVTRIRQIEKEWFEQNMSPDVSVYHSEVELFADESLELDAMIIATPHYAHEEQVITSLKRGWHVLCEKPSGVYTNQAKHMNEEAARHDLVFSMMFNQRTNPMFKKMKEIVASGKYGTMKRVSWIMTDWYRPDIYYTASAWRATWAKDGGGVLLNQCPHNLDLLQWICGMPVNVRAFCHEGKYHDIEVEDDVTAYMEFPNGATGVFITSTGEGPGVNRLEIVMDNARLLFEDGDLRVFELEEDEPTYRKTSQEPYAKMKGNWKTVEVEGENVQHLGIMQNFADAVINGAPLIASGEEGINSLMLSNAMYLSSWKGKTVELPLSDACAAEFETELKKKCEQE